MANTDVYSAAERFPVEMRVSPTMVWYSPTDGASGNIHWNAANRSVSSTFAANRKSTGRPVLGASAGPGLGGAHWTADAEIT